MDKIFCDVVRQQFAHDFHNRNDSSLFLTQNDNYPFRLFMVQPSQYPGTRYPFNYTEASGDEDFSAIVSIRNVQAAPVTLASTAVMTAIPNGFEGLLHLNTQEVADFLAGRPELDAAFCIDLVDDSGNRISPFRHSITLRATDSGSVTTIPGIIFDPDITGLTGGGVTNLDGIVTVSKAINSLQILVRVISGSRSESTWQLIAGTTAEDEDGGIVRPDDYTASTNEKIWVRVAGL